MKDRCGNFEEGLLRLALGGEDESAVAHVSSCKRCAKSLSELRRIRSASTATYEAPESLLLAASQLMPRTERRSLRLLGTSLAGTLARSVPTLEEFQVVFGDGELILRLGASRDGAIWTIHGQVTPENADVECDGNPVDSPNGRFRLSGPALDQAQILVTVNGVEWSVPPIAEVLRDAGR